MTQWGKAGQVGQVQLSILNILLLTSSIDLARGESLTHPWLTAHICGEGVGIWAMLPCHQFTLTFFDSWVLQTFYSRPSQDISGKNLLDQLAPFQAAIILHLLTAKVNDGRMSWKDPASYRKDIYWGQEETRMWTIIFDSFKLEVEPDCAFVAGKRLVVEVRSLGILKQRQVNNLTGESINCKYQKPIWPIYISSRLCYNIKLDIINLNI